MWTTDLSSIVLLTNFTRIAFVCNQFYEDLLTSFFHRYYYSTKIYKFYETIYNFSVYLPVLADNSGSKFLLPGAKHHLLYTMDQTIVLQIFGSSNSSQPSLGHLSVATPCFSSACMYSLKHLVQNKCAQPILVPELLRQISHCWIEPGDIGVITIFLSFCWIWFES